MASAEPPPFSSAVNSLSAPSSPPGNNLTALSVESPSYTFVEYFLRLKLHASTARIVEAWEVSSPQLTLQFEKRSQGILTLDSWVDVTQLPSSNTEDDIIKRGFHFSSGASGMKFSVGHFRLPEGGAKAEDKIIRKRFLLCKVAVGRAYNSTEDFSKIATVPDGYDSFVIDRDRPSLASVTAEPPSSVSDPSDQLDYIVKDSAQILPTFVVVFEYDPEAERRSRQKVACENCEKSVASVFCQADAANLCDSCDRTMHATKLAARHVRVPLENGPQTFSMCRQHPDKVVEFFCPTCSKPVCVHCKMVGHHSTGDAARHKLVTVAEAFKSVSEAAQAADPILEVRKQTIRSQIDAVSDRARAVESNAAEVQQQLEEIYRKAQNDLKAITKKKLNILKGDVVELQRELGEIGQLEAFLAYQQTGGNATQFILDWSHHQRLRSELHAFSFFREAIDVSPDIKINGAIQVHVDGAGSHLFHHPTATTASQESSSPLKPSSLFDSSSKPRYSPMRARPLPTFDVGSFAKTRKASDFITETLQSVQLAASHAGHERSPSATAQAKN